MRALHGQLCRDKGRKNPNISRSNCWEHLWKTYGVRPQGKLNFQPISLGFPTLWVSVPFTVFELFSNSVYCRKATRCKLVLVHSKADDRCGVTGGPSRSPRVFIRHGHLSVLTVVFGFSLDLVVCSLLVPHSLNDHDEIFDPCLFIFVYESHDLTFLKNCTLAKSVRIECRIDRKIHRYF